MNFTKGNPKNHNCQYGCNILILDYHFHLLHFKLFVDKSKKSEQHK